MAPWVALAPPDVESEKAPKAPSLNGVRGRADEYKPLWSKQPSRCCQSVRYS